MPSTHSSPRILYLSEVAPKRISKFGGEIRCANVLQALQQVGKVEVVVLASENRDASTSSNSDSKSDVAHSLAVNHVPQKSLVDRLRWTFDPKSDYPNGCKVDRSSVDWVLGCRKEFDLIWFFKLRSAEVFPNASWNRSVVDIDDLPSTYERASLVTATGALDRFHCRRRLFAWQRREKLLGNRFSVLTVCSEEDKQYLNRSGVNVPIQVVPNGFEKPSTEPIHCPVAPPRIGFIGLFEYLPNRDGVQWFVDKCWPRIKSVVPGARLRLIGQGSREFAKTLGPDVEGLGWVENASQEMSSWSAMLVPIRMGAGTRIKIAYGYSQKCPIVSTSIGAYGYGATNQKQMYLADSAADFANACMRAIGMPNEAAEIAQRAWLEFQDKWTWDAIRPRIWAAVEDCLRQG
jgi:glycosyltransferase involved in cell wall biosynthesis